MATPDLLDERDLSSVEDVRRHVGSFALRKAAMRANKKPGRRPKPESSKPSKGWCWPTTSSADNDYLICDTEYTFRCEGQRKSGRIDLVAAYRPPPRDPAAKARLGS